MLAKPISLIEFILAEEKNLPDARGDFSLLLTHIEYASRIIASHVTKAGLVDILGKANKTNAYQEEVQRLDEMSNQLLIDTLSGTGVVSAIASEELEEPIMVKEDAKYMVFFDPIDGSSNIDTNASIGTIFSIYKTSPTLLISGREQVAAGYIIYGSSTMFVYTAGHGVNGFTLDPGVGSFLLSHPDIKIPDKGSIYSVNEGNYHLWSEKTQAYVDALKRTDPPPKSRYIGSLVADLHRTLLKGGIFLYPSDHKHPEGKLRLLYEINPFSFIFSQAGGKAQSNGENPLEITPLSLRHTAPLTIGSPENVVEHEQLTR